MRVRLADLRPEWLHDGPGRQRMGVAFDCAEHSNCRVEAWFDTPYDSGQPITGTGGRVLHEVEGEDFETLCLYPPVRHGNCFVHVYEGEVAFC